MMCDGYVVYKSAASFSRQAQSKDVCTFCEHNSLLKVSLGLLVHELLY